MLAFYLRYRNLLQLNIRHRNRHAGQRCFVVCNGPSVRTQDLYPLHDEVVMTVSSGYLLDQFSEISPAYHFVPPVTYRTLNERDVVQWFQEMESRLGGAELFLGSSEHPVVRRHNLFSQRKVSYLCCARPFWPRERRIIDIRGIVPTVASVPIMCLMVALYMGFKRIYLLGTEHDSLVTRQYSYAFEPTVLKGKDFAVDESGQVRVPVYDELVAYVALWRQYRSIKGIAEANGISIFNATAGGMLDEFPRVDLHQALAEA